MTGYRNSEVVVDTADVAGVVELVGELGAEARVLDTIDAFDVAQVQIGDLGRTVEQEERRATAGRLREPSDLDLLLTLVRERFPDRYGRLPSMGKNRDMQVMEGHPHTGGGEGEPRSGRPFALAPRTSVRGRGCRVGVLDTAVFPVDALRGRYLTDDEVDGKEPWPVWAGHAAFVCGRILRRAPGAELDVREVLAEADGTAPAWCVASRMAEFLGSGVQVLNVSLGGFTADHLPPFLMIRAVERLGTQMVVVAAAGNHGNDAVTEAGSTGPASPLWPAALPGVVAVGAAAARFAGGGHELVVAPFTPPRVPWIALLAPGVDVLSTYIEGRVEFGPGREQDFDGTAVWSGTSFAAADVTGELASIVQRVGVSAREALALLCARHPADTDYDVRPVR